MKKLISTLAVTLAISFLVSVFAVSIYVNAVFKVIDTSGTTKGHGQTLAEAYSGVADGQTIVLLAANTNQTHSEASPLVIDKKITLTTEKNIYNPDRAIKYTGSGSFITIEDGGELTLDYSILIGKTDSTTKKGGLIYVKKGGKLIINSEATLKSSVLSASGSLGGAVYAEDGARVVVNGGTFTGNSATKGKDLYAEFKEDVTINGGTFNFVYGKERPCDICKMNIILSGEIGIVFHTNVKTAYLDGSFVLSSRTGDTVTYKITNCSKDADGNYLAKYNVSAVEMAEPVKIQVLDKSGNLLAEKEKSVAGYASSLLADNSTSSDEADLVKKLINYGYYAQLACSAADGWEIGNDYAQIQNFSSPAVNASVFEGFAPVYSGDGKCTVSYKLAFDYKTDFILYISSGSVPEVTVDGNNATVYECLDGRYAVVIKGISLTNLAQSYDVVINGSLKITVSPLSYGALAFESGSQTTKNAVASMYELFNAFVAFNN